MTGTCNHHPDESCAICEPFAVHVDERSKRERFVPGDKVTVSEAGDGPVWKGVVQEVCPESMTVKVSSVEWWKGYRYGARMPYAIGSIQSVNLAQQGEGQR